MWLFCTSGRGLKHFFVEVCALYLQRMNIQLVRPIAVLDLETADHVARRRRRFLELLETAGFRLGDIPALPGIQDEYAGFGAIHIDLELVAHQILQRIAPLAIRETRDDKFGIPIAADEGLLPCQGQRMLSIGNQVGGMLGVAAGSQQDNREQGKNVLHRITPDARQRIRPRAAAPAGRHQDSRGSRVRQAPRAAR